MAEALYGDHGFYLGAGIPSRHFRTAAHTGSSWAGAVAAFAQRVDEALDSADDFTVVDIGAGGGELLAELAAIVPDRWSLVAVDVAERPKDLPSRVRWQRQFPLDMHGIVLAVELFDVVPVNVVELAEDGLHLVEVDEDGTERLGAPADLGDRDWIAQWWPLRSVGERAEVGWPRDNMWREITGRVDAGAILAIDYAANPSEHVAGTLSGYRNGRHRSPIPDGTMDLTAHVMFESMQCDDDLLLTQREALRRLGLDASPPEYHHNPDTYLADLNRASEAAELMNPHGLGGFTWLIHPVGLTEPLLG